jgi:RNA polymerase sigma-70 factor (ECF subfamily)
MDEDLIEAYYACDDAAFQQLYGRHLGRLIGFFENRGVHGQAEDLAEETFLRVVRTKHTGQNRFDRTQGTAFTSWLFTIAFNILHDHHRREGRQPDAASGLLVEEAVAPVAEEEQEDLPADLVQAAQAFTGPLGECLRQLSEPLRDVLLLDLLGQSLNEIAEQLGIAYGTAGGRVSKAREQMRVCVRQHGYRFAPREGALPPGVVLVMPFPDQRLVQVFQAELERTGHQIVTQLAELQTGDRVVMVFPEDGEVIVQRIGSSREEGQR